MEAICVGPLHVAHESGCGVGQIWTCALGKVRDGGTLGTEFCYLCRVGEGLAVAVSPGRIHGCVDGARVFEGNGPTIEEIGDSVGLVDIEFAFGAVAREVHGEHFGKYVLRSCWKCFVQVCYESGVGAWALAGVKTIVYIDRQVFEAEASCAAGKHAWVAFVGEPSVGEEVAAETEMPIAGCLFCAV